MDGPPPARGARALTPDDLAAALDEAGLREHFESLPPSHRREYVDWIDEAKRADTRERRVAKAVEMVAEGQTAG